MNHKPQSILPAETKKHLPLRGKVSLVLRRVPRAVGGLLAGARVGGAAAAAARLAGGVGVLGAGAVAVAAAGGAGAARAAGA